MALRPEAVPSSVRALIPEAEEWGIGDDFDRDGNVDTSSRSELEALVVAVDGAPDEPWSWLVGPVSMSGDPSSENVAITNMTMAAHSCRSNTCLTVRGSQLS